jgi:hypothetical protein
MPALLFVELRRGVVQYFSFCMGCQFACANDGVRRAI